MPTYSYKCTACGKKTEILCSFYEKKEREQRLKCEFCNSTSFIPIFKINLGCTQKDRSCGGSCGGCSGCG